MDRWASTREELLRERERYVRSRDVVTRRDRHMSEKANEVIVLIDRALDRLSDGTYGLCASCGNPIPEDRLEAVPYAALCMGCQGDQERAGGH